jgi:hypothetical protein
MATLEDHAPPPRKTPAAARRALLSEPHGVTGGVHAGYGVAAIPPGVLLSGKCFQRRLAIAPCDDPIRHA